MNNRIKSGIKTITDECYATTLNDLTKKFVGTVIIATITFFVLGFIFTDTNEENE